MRIPVSIRNTTVILLLAAFLLGAFSYMSTNPAGSRIETITLQGQNGAADYQATLPVKTIIVADPYTGKDMEFSVPADATASADAAAYAYIDCRKRFSSRVAARINGSWRNVACGRTHGTGGNSVQEVGDYAGPICVYYGGTLAGCASINRTLYLDNRPGAQANVATQPAGT